MKKTIKNLLKNSSLIYTLYIIIALTILPTLAVSNTDDGTSSLECVTTPATIIVHKIVCTNEEDLPNWGNGGSDITSNSAQDFVDSHPDCYFEDGWNFQWGYETVSNPGDNTGEADSSTGWTTFGSTDSDGQASVDISNIGGSSRIWFREIFKEKYLPFIGISGSGNVSAEFYCHKDVLNYDNYDYVINPKLGQTYYCIAFNVLICNDGHSCLN